MVDQRNNGYKAFSQTQVTLVSVLLTSVTRINGEVWQSQNGKDFQKIFEKQRSRDIKLFSE